MISYDKIMHAAHRNFNSLIIRFENLHRFKLCDLIKKSAAMTSTKISTFIADECS